MVVLLRRNGDLSKLDSDIVAMVERDRPETVRELLKLVQEKYRLPEEEIAQHVLDLQNQGKLTFSGQSASHMTPKAYVFSSQAYWYWVTIGLVLGTVASVFVIPENLFPLVYVRYFLGSFFVLFLPGYAFTKALFPKQVPIRTGSEEIDNIERFALSAGMSLALVPMVGLALNYTPFGITFVPVTLSLLALTIIFATAAFLREQQPSVST
jgi:hypothetical protein